jgi:anhydro-N-acetylmuramic acid kinase
VGAGDLIAFDTGPGNALIDDWVRDHKGGDYDKDGMLAAKGTVEKDLLQKLLTDPYFLKKPPKSLDRDHWDVSSLKKLSTEDGAATLAAFTVESVKWSLEFLPEKPRQWLVAGGGRHNKFLMEYLGITLAAPVNPVETLGWNGDALEAEGFAYLAVRSLLGEPLSLPTTTGVPKPLTGGVLHKP